jgi:hypothetical protein
VTQQYVQIFLTISRNQNNAATHVLNTGGQGLSRGGEGGGTGSLVITPKDMFHICELVNHIGTPTVPWTNKLYRHQS